MSKQTKRLNRSKKEIVSNIQLTQDAERRRSLIRDIIFPYLKEMDDTVGYTKIFLQAFSGMVEGVLENKRKITTIGHISSEIEDKLKEVFKVKDPEQKKEYQRYLELTNLLKDISIQDMSYAAELPRYIDGYLMKDKNKEPIKNISIDEILGKD